MLTQTIPDLYQRKCVQLDANGNTLADANHTYSYNNHNQLTGVNANVAYTYNALGQRVSKTVAGVFTTYVYDTAGQLLGEYGADGRQRRSGW